MENLRHLMIFDSKKLRLSFNSVPTYEEIIHKEVFKKVSDSVRLHLSVIRTLT